MIGFVLFHFHKIAHYYPISLCSLPRGSSNEEGHPSDSRVVVVVVFLVVLIELYLSLLEMVTVLAYLHCTSLFTFIRFIYVSHLLYQYISCYKSLYLQSHNRGG